MSTEGIWRQRVADLEERITKAERALHGIAPWLSASLEEGQPCAEYRTACEAVFIASRAAGMAEEWYP